MAGGLYMTKKLKPLKPNGKAMAFGYGCRAPENERPSSPVYKLYYKLLEADEKIWLPYIFLESLKSRLRRASNWRWA